MTSTEPEAIEPMADLVPWHGILVQEGVETGDDRLFQMNSLSHADFPLPLRWAKADNGAHSGAVTVADISWMQRLTDGRWAAAGYLLQTSEADEMVGLVSHFGRFGVSIDADSANMTFEEDETRPSGGLMSFSEGRVRGATVVDIPAFTQAWVALGEWDPEDPELAGEQLTFAMLATEPPEGAICAHPGCEATPDMSVDIDDDTFDAILTCEEHAPQYDGKPLPEFVDLASGKVAFKRGPGWITNPEDTKRLHDYWTKPGEPGYAKIGWGAPGDFNRCRVLVGEKIAKNSPEDTRFLNQICAQWHKDALGIWPGEHHSAETTGLEGQPLRVAPSVNLVASAGFCAPSEAFKDPEYGEPGKDKRLRKMSDGTVGAPLTVTEDGRVSGHIARWGACHTGFSGVCIEPPQSRTEYAYFLTGQVLTTDGPVSTGTLTLGTEHPGLRMRGDQAMAWYSNTGNGWADVACGEDEYGIWVAGMVRPGTSEEALYAARASSPSGDWRRIGGSLEMIGVLQVNSGGYPTPRPQTSVQDGVQISLVAAGVLMDSEEQVDQVEALATALAPRIMAQLQAAAQLDTAATFVQQVSEGLANERTELIDSFVIEEG